ncbi:MAG: Gfo/Idh/MocA family oxidoreductase [Bacteroidales bacterium]|nr:Gfo/Idh/MocA family oxidoreductase [Bacteroidales bacterium]
MLGKADTVVVATPNNTHAGLILDALRVGYDVICEKPLVSNADDLGVIKAMEGMSGNRVYGVMQMRLHPNAAAIDGSVKSEVSVTYHTPRGAWYWNSWKGDPKRSGGLAMNIGVHFFDLLLWKFGGLVDFGEHRQVSRDTIEGEFWLERARVKYSLSVDSSLPAKREVTVNGTAIDLTTGFDNLHTEVYREILSGRGLGIDDMAPAIILAEQIQREVQGVMV